MVAGGKGARYACRALTPGDPGYPAKLRDLARPPAVFLAGAWRHDGPTVAVVGSRSPTDDGADFARELARDLARSGVAVISGLARGIDAAAHRGALEGGGASGAVLGTCLDETYPPEHRTLQDALASSLGLMSEIPPGRPATRATFATRNRLLAALSDLVVVVQGRAGSGALLTASEARRLARPLAAVPWDPREPLAEAPLALIRKGAAALIRGPADVMELLRPDIPVAPRAPSRAVASPHVTAALTAAEARLYRALRERPLPLEHLAVAASLSAAELGAALLALELQGLARRDAGGTARRTRSPRG